MLAEAFAGSLSGAAALMAYAVRSPSSNLLAPSISRGAPDRPSLALTFDDGPSESTEFLLELLQKQNVSATFFVCGENVLRLPQAARSVLAAGHEIGNHSQTHPHLCFRSRQTIQDEFSRAQGAIGDTLGLRPVMMRPPFGVRWFGFSQVQRDLRLMSVMWSTIGLDWKLPARDISLRLERGGSNGAILCLHDGRKLIRRPDITQTLKALNESIPALLDRGFRFETVSQLLCPKN